MILLQIHADILLFARLAGMMLVFLFMRGKINQNLKRKFGQENIVDKVVSLENIFTLVAYLVLIGVLSFIFPLAWQIWKESSTFWWTQALITLAVIGIFSLQKWYVSLFFFLFFISAAVILTAVTIIRDPRINPPRVIENNPVIEIKIPDSPEIPAISSYSTVEIETSEESNLYPEAEKPPIFFENNDDSVWYVDAPVGEYGKIVYPQKGFKLEFWPEGEVYGIQGYENQPNYNQPFEYGPDRGRLDLKFESVTWASRSDHATRVKVIRKKR